MSTFLCKNGVRKEYFLTPTFIIEPKKSVHFHTVCDTITVAKAPKGAISIEEDLLMNKSELISEVASKTAMPKKDAEKAVNKPPVEHDR